MGDLVEVPGSVLALVVNWGTNQQIDLSVSLTFSITFSNNVTLSNQQFSFFHEKWKKNINFGPDFSTLVVGDILGYIT